MHLLDMVALMLIGISHVTLYFYLINYQRFHFLKIVLLSIIFSFLLGFVVTLTGYPELNFVMLFLFLFTLGFLKVDLTVSHNLYFTLASIVSISLLKVMLLEIGMALFMWSPLNLYLWTASVIHFIAAIVILCMMLFLRRSIRLLAAYLIDSPVYPISFILLAIASLLLVILTSPKTSIFSLLSEKYFFLSYNAAIILFFILLLLILVSSHAAKEKILEQQREQLEDELLNYVKKLEQLHDELATFRHDYINILLSLNDAIRTKNISEIEQIYNNVIEPTAEFMNDTKFEIYKLGNVQIPELKSLLNVKLIAAYQKKLHVVLDIPLAISKISIPTVQLIRIASIFIDNAIEEALQTTDKTLQISFFEIKDELYFIVSNSLNDKSIHLENLYHKGFSTQSNDRGYGLHTVKKLIDQSSNLTLETKITNDSFTQTLIIKNKENN